MKQPLTSFEKGIAILRSGGVGVLPTDTLYGIVGSALSRRTVERIYAARRRNPAKPMIILIGSIRDLAQFGIRPTPKIKKLLIQLWPGKVSVVLPLARSDRTPSAAAKKFLTKFSYLHRGTGTLAFRLPARTVVQVKKRWMLPREKLDLQKMLRATGPLVAPSANFEGEPPAKTIRAAKKYFGGDADFYLDVGRRDAKPSKLVRIDAGRVTVLRK